MSIERSDGPEPEAEKEFPPHAYKLAERIAAGEKPADTPERIVRAVDRWLQDEGRGGLIDISSGPGVAGMLLRLYASVQRAGTELYDVVDAVVQILEEEDRAREIFDSSPKLAEIKQNELAEAIRPAMQYTEEE